MELNCPKPIEAEKEEMDEIEDFDLEIENIKYKLSLLLLDDNKQLLIVLYNSEDILLDCYKKVLDFNDLIKVNIIFIIFSLPMILNTISKKIKKKKFVLTKDKENRKFDFI